MKHMATVFAVLAALGFATGVHAEVSPQVKEAETRVKQALPAESPQESTGTVKGSQLTKPDPNYKPPPMYREPPPPKQEEVDPRNLTNDPDIKKGIDSYEAGKHPASGTRTEK
jgi:hypothetical protein